MSTKPHHDYESIAKDAERVAAAAEEDLGDKKFGKHVDAHDLAILRANVGKLRGAAATQPARLHEQVASRAHVGAICASITEACQSVRDAAALEWFSDADPSKNDETKARAFGYGRHIDPAAVSSVEGFAHQLLASAEASPHDAAKVHLDKKGIEHLEDMLHALEGADIAHVKTKANRHDASTAVDSLAHLVNAEKAHIRFVAKRAFRGDEARLARYANTLPRHAVKPRSRHAPTGSSGLSAAGP